MESAVMSEIVKTITHRGADPTIDFWRTSTGIEVDFLIESGGQLLPIEVRLSATPRPAMTASITALREDVGDFVQPGYFVHPGEVRSPLTSGVTALPINEL